FHILAAATPLTRDEYIDQQRQEAARLRDAILGDPTASQALVVLAADRNAWTGLYLAALTQAGLLRPEDEPPEVRESPQLVSLMATLASGILAGPAGDRTITDGDLAKFFADVRRWYGNKTELSGPAAPPPAAGFDLHESAHT